MLPRPFPMKTFADTLKVGHISREFLLSKMSETTTGNGVRLVEGMQDFDTA